MNRWTEAKKYYLIEEKDLQRLMEKKTEPIPPPPPREKRESEPPIPLATAEERDPCQFYLEILPINCKKRAAFILKALFATEKFAVNHRNGAAIIEGKEVTGSSICDLLQCLTKTVPPFVSGKAAHEMPDVIGLGNVIDLLAQSPIGI